MAKDFTLQETDDRVKEKRQNHDCTHLHGIFMVCGLTAAETVEAASRSASCR